MTTIETKTVANVNEIVDIINKLNYKGETFEYESTSTFDDNSKGRFFGSVRKNGNTGGFSILEFVVDGELKAVRFFNHYKDITVEFKLGDFAPSYDRFDNVIEIPADQPANITAAETDGSEDDTDDDNPFDFLPALDELNDVNDNPDNNPPDDIMKKYKGVCWIIKHRITKNGRHMWFAHTGIIGKVEAAERLNKFGLTIEQYLAAEEQEKAQWEVEHELSLKAYLHARHIEEKIRRDSKPIDDNEDVFALLPALDELNDVNDVAPVIQPLRQIFYFTPIDDNFEPNANEFCQIFTDNDVVTYLNGEFNHVSSTKYAAWYSPYFGHYGWHIFKDGKIFGVGCTRDVDEFFAEMERRGACSFDTPDLPPADEYSISNEALNIATNAEIDNAIAQIKREIDDIEIAIESDQRDLHAGTPWYPRMTPPPAEELKANITRNFIKRRDCRQAIARLEESRPVDDTPDNNPPADNSFASVFAAEFDNNGNCHVELNGEHVQISNGKLSYVKAPRYNLAFDPDKKRFTYLGRVIAKSKVATIIKDKNTAADQRDKLREFFRPYIHNTGAFEYLISIDYCDDSDSNFGARFDTYEQAYDFAKHVDIMLKKFAGVKSFVRIRIASNRELIYERDFDGHKFWTLSAESANYLAADNPDLPAPVFSCDIDDNNRTFIGQDGTRFIVTGDSVNISTKGTELTINGRRVANYRTIKAALAAADYVYYFAREIDDDNYLPEFDYDPDNIDTIFDNRNKRDRSKATIYIDKPQYLVEVATRINKFNHDAPHGWEIIFDAENKLFAVEFTGEHVANLDSLALTNILTPEEFFAQYAPLVNHGHAQNQFISEREAEIAQLQAMKADLGNDAERLKILDDLIADNQKEISATINAG